MGKKHYKLKDFPLLLVQLVPSSGDEFQCDVSASGSNWDIWDGDPLCLQVPEPKDSHTEIGA